MKSLKEIADDIRFRGITEEQVSSLVAEVYEKGYNGGLKDQRKVKENIKIRYSILLNWMVDQLNQFSIYTRRREYKDIVNGILKLTDDYIYENSLRADLSKDSKKSLILEVGLPLVDIVGNFIEEEEQKGIVDEE